MYCYYCGNKIDEKKANENLFKNRVKDEKNRIKFALSDENRSFKNALSELSKKEKSGEDVSALKQDIVHKHDLKVEEIKKSYNASLIEDSSNGKGEVGVSYICPRCGHIIKSGFTLQDKKSLSAASHAELQRSRNDFSRGMAMLILGGILLIIAIVFLLLCRKASLGYAIATNVAEFWVFLILAIISVILLIGGSIFTFKSVKKKKMYTELLKDINNETFVQ